MSEFSARRIMMVDTQVRPSDVTKFPIIEAMLDVPREADRIGIGEAGDVADGISHASTIVPARTVSAPCRKKRWPIASDSS